MTQGTSLISIPAITNWIIIPATAPTSAPTMGRFHSDSAPAPTIAPPKNQNKTSNLPCGLTTILAVPSTISVIAMNSRWSENLPMPSIIGNNRSQARKPQSLRSSVFTFPIYLASNHKPLIPNREPLTAMPTLRHKPTPIWRCSLVYKPEKSRRFPTSLLPKLTPFVSKLNPSDKMNICSPVSKKTLARWPKSYLISPLHACILSTCSVTSHFGRYKLQQLAGVFRRTRPACTFGVSAT